MLSQRRGYEVLILLSQPFRCRDCHTRYWWPLPPFLALVLSFLLLGLLGFGGYYAYLWSTGKL